MPNPALTRKPTLKQPIEKVRTCRVDALNMVPLKISTFFFTFWGGGVVFVFNEVFLFVSIE